MWYCHWSIVSKDSRIVVSLDIDTVIVIVFNELQHTLFRVSKSHVLQRKVGVSIAARMALCLGCVHGA
jgi:hypothetical protein